MAMATLVSLHPAARTHQDTCPVECQKPHCVNGAKWNGGKSLAGNVCEDLCSKKFGETRRELNISWGDAFFQHKHILQMQNERDSLERDKIYMILSVKGYCGSGDKYAAGSSLNCTLCKAGFLSEVGINREEMIEISQASVQKPAVVKIEDTLRIREAILEEAHGLNEISVVRFQCDLTLVLFLRLLCQSIFVLPSFALLSFFIG